jgi:hypothetical protein
LEETVITLTSVRFGPTYKAFVKFQQGRVASDVTYDFGVIVYNGTKQEENIRFVVQKQPITRMGISSLLLIKAYH